MLEALSSSHAERSGSVLDDLWWAGPPWGRSAWAGGMGRVRQWQVTARWWRSEGPGSRPQDRGRVLPATALTVCSEARPPRAPWSLAWPVSLSDSPVRGSHQPCGRPGRAGDGRLAAWSGVRPRVPARPPALTRRSPHSGHQPHRAAHPGHSERRAVQAADQRLSQRLHAGSQAAGLGVRQPAALTVAALRRGQRRRRGAVLLYIWFPGTLLI